MKTIREMCRFSGYIEYDDMIVALEAREKERDESERERVKAILERTLSEELRKEIINDIYPPPEPPIEAWKCDLREKEFPIGYSCILIDGGVTVCCGCEAEYTKKRPEPARHSSVASRVIERLKKFTEELEVSVGIDPPPEPAILKAGYWWKRHKEHHKSWACYYNPIDSEAFPGWEYRRWDDPPPEVTEKVETQQPKVEPQLPTFEEWCEVNVDGWEWEHHISWYRASVHQHSRNIPDDVFTELRGGERHWSIVIYSTTQEALNALRDALLRLGRIRP